MRRDEVFVNSERQDSDFQFDRNVASVFDDMVQRSVPFYLEQQRMIQSLGATFWIPDTVVYDLGCSTGTTLINLAQVIGGSARYVGYDTSEPMLDRAREKIEASGLADCITVTSVDLNRSLANVSLDNAGVVTMCWTLQFIRPLQRDRLVRRISESLAPDGAFLVTEKVLTNHSHLNRFFIEAYYDLKKRHGYSDLEVVRKREALENVLIPYRVDENRELFQRNGFEIVETFFQWYNFVGFLCLKRSR